MIRYYETVLKYYSIKSSYFYLQIYFTKFAKIFLTFLFANKIGL